MCVSLLLLIVSEFGSSIRDERGGWLVVLVVSCVVASGRAFFSSPQNFFLV